MRKEVGLVLAVLVLGIFVLQGVVAVQYNFGGMYTCCGSSGGCYGGYCGYGGTLNPLAGNNCACPTNFTAYSVRPYYAYFGSCIAYLCLGDPKNTSQLAVFGGMFTKTTAYVNNPLTGGYNCSAGYVEQKGIVKTDTDYAAYYCYSTDLNKQSLVEFDGLYSNSGGVNPFTKTETCNSTYSSLQLISDNYNLFFCYKLVPQLVDADSDGYLEIHNCTELQQMQNNLTANYELMNNIDCSDTKNWNGGAGFKPIGWASLPIGTTDSFNGNFDGRGFIISGLYINRSSEVSVGLFGHTNYANFSNVGLVDFNITAGDLTGGLVGLSRSDSIPGHFSTINNVHLMGNSYIRSNSYSGGLAGEFYGKVYNSSSNLTLIVGYFGQANSGYYVGGLVGNQLGPINSSYSVGSVNCTYTFCGGLVGFQQSGAIIFNSYSSANVNGSQMVGGLVGRADGTITNSYSTGMVAASAYIGGLTGYNGASTSSYWDNVTSGQSSSTTGVPKSTVDMKLQSTFVGWDFTNDWTMCNDYPKLKWQGLANCSYIANGNCASPYIINNCAQLQNMSNNLNAVYKLGQNIDCNVAPYNTGVGFVPIDNFAGKFDGNGFNITGLYVNKASYYAGLFGRLSYATVANVGLVNANIIGGGYSVGGIAGESVGSSVYNSFVTGSIRGYEYVGGFIGSISGGGSTTISNSYSTASVLSSSSYVGGFVGDIGGGAGATIYNSYATGSVSGTSYVGGFIGYTSGGNPPIIYNSYATGSVSGTSYVGGFIGDNMRGIFNNSYSTGSVSGSSYKGCFAGVSSDDGSSSIVKNNFCYNFSGLKCIGSGNANCTLVNNLNYFYNYNNVPMNLSTSNGWDFNAWNSSLNGVSFPVLKTNNTFVVCVVVPISLSWFNTNESNISSADLNDDVVLYFSGANVGRLVNYTIYKGTSAILSSSTTKGFVVWKVNATGTYSFNESSDGGATWSKSNNLVVGTGIDRSPSTYILNRNYPEYNYSVGANINFSQFTQDGDDLLNLTWNFGDGNSVNVYDYSLFEKNVIGNSSLGDVAHSYSSQGIYDVSLTAREKDGDAGDVDYYRIIIFGPGINVIPVITNPENGLSYGSKWINFNASQSYVVNCSNNMNPYNFSTADGGLFCKYVHNPGAIKTSASYNLTLTWGMNDGRVMSGDFNNAYNQSVVFKYKYASSGLHLAGLNIKYSGP